MRFPRKGGGEAQSLVRAPGRGVWGAGRGYGRHEGGWGGLESQVRGCRGGVCSGICEVRSAREGNGKSTRKGGIPPAREITRILDFQQMTAKVFRGFGFLTLLHRRRRGRMRLVSYARLTRAK